MQQKNAKQSMFSKLVQGSTASSAPPTPLNRDDYFVIPKLSTDAKKQPDGKDKSIQTSTSPPQAFQSAISECLGDPKELAKLYETIRTSVCASSLTGREGLSYNMFERKRWYGINTVNITGVETAIPLARPTIGPGTDQRLTGSIKLHHTKIRGTISRLLNNGTTPGAYESPNICLAVVVNIIPAVPGGAAVCWGTDTFPAGGSDTILSRLGGGVAFNAVAVQNPAFSATYKIKHCSHFPLNSNSEFIAGVVTPNQAFPSHMAWNFEINVNWYGLDVNYLVGTDFPIINEPVWYFVADIGYPAQITDTMNYSFETVFEDAPDDINSMSVESIYKRLNKSPPLASMPNCLTLL